MNKELLIFLLIILMLFSSGCIAKNQKPEFEVSNIKVEPKKALKNQNITITAKIKNPETTEEKFDVKLHVNEEIVDSVSLNLERKDETQVEFNIKRGYGEYFVRIGDKSTEFVVGGVIIKDVNYDAKGLDQHNLNGEWVEIQNKWNHPVNLKGWYIFDYSLENDVKYYFGDFTLEPGKSVKIHTGTGNDTEKDLYWNWNEPIWGHIADLAYLYNESGELIDSYQWVTDSKDMD